MRYSEVKSETLLSRKRKKLKSNISSALGSIDDDKLESLTDDMEKIKTNGMDRTYTDEYIDEEVEFHKEENVPISKLVLKPNGESHDHNHFSSKKKNKKKKN